MSRRVALADIRRERERASWQCLTECDPQGGEDALCALLQPSPHACWSWPLAAGAGHCEYWPQPASISWAALCILPLFIFQAVPPASVFRLFSLSLFLLFLMLPHNPCVAPKFPKVSLLGDDRPHAWAALGLPFTVLPCTPNAHKHPLSQLVNKLLFSEASFFFILENV